MLDKFVILHRKPKKTSIMKLHTSSYDCMAENFDEMFLTDPKLLSLFLTASLEDTEEYCPTVWGNLYAFLDRMKDEWLHGTVDDYMESAKEDKEEMEPELLMDLVKGSMKSFLLDLIEE